MEKIFQYRSLISNQFSYSPLFPSNENTSYRNDKPSLNFSKKSHQNKNLTVINSEANVPGFSATVHAKFLLPPLLSFQTNILCGFAYQATKVEGFILVPHPRRTRSYRFGDASRLFVSAVTIASISADLNYLNVGSITQFAKWRAHCSNV